MKATFHTNKSAADVFSSMSYLCKAGPKESTLLEIQVTKDSVDFKTTVTEKNNVLNQITASFQGNGDGFAISIIGQKDINETLKFLSKSSGSTITIEVGRIYPLMRQECYPKAFIDLINKSGEKLTLFQYYKNEFGSDFYIGTFQQEESLGASTVSDFRKRLQQVIKAAPSKDPRDYLNAVAFSKSRIAATDGYRIHISTSPLQVVNTDHCNPQLVHKKACVALVRLLKHSGDVKFYWHNEGVSIFRQIENCDVTLRASTLTSRNKYPNLDSILPTADTLNGVSLFGSKSDWDNFFKNLRKWDLKKSDSALPSGVKFELSRNGESRVSLVVFRKPADGEKIKGEVTGKFPLQELIGNVEGSVDLEVTFNIDYLSDAIKGTSSTTTLILQNGPLLARSVLIKTEDDHLSCIAEMRA